MPSPQGEPVAHERNRRSDATRNRERILEAARALYGSDGLGVSMAAVSRAAGVGKATLFRHFATPDELINAVFAEHMNAYISATEKALADPDPWHGFISYVTAVCQMQADDRGFADVLTVTFEDAEALEALRVQSYEGFLRVIERARTTGHLRTDFASEDLILVLISNAAVVAATDATRTTAWRRLLAHFLRAFAEPGAPLPPAPAAPSSAELDLAMKYQSHASGEPGS